MPFVPPPWVPQLPFDPPDSISIGDFMLDENYGRHPLGYANNPFTCGLTGKTYTSLEVKERVDFLARSCEGVWVPSKQRQRVGQGHCRLLSQHSEFGALAFGLRMTLTWNS